MLASEKPGLGIEVDEAAAAKFPFPAGPPNFDYSWGTTRRKDGTVIGNVIVGIVRSQLLGLQGVEFDASKFQYVGAPNNENSLLLMTKTSGISRFEQLLEPSGKVLSIGDSGAATTNHTAALLTRDVLNANIKVVSGYTAAGGVDVAMDQGELGGQYNDWASIKTRTLAKIESGEWLLIGQLTDKPLLNLPQ